MLLVLKAETKSKLLLKDRICRTHHIPQYLLVI